jgi:hypothetical protein
MVIANPSMDDLIKATLDDSGAILSEDVILVQSPLLVMKNEVESMLDVFPLWIQYLNHNNSLNNPFKIIVIGANWYNRQFPYFSSIFDKQNTWDGVMRLIKKTNINYTDVPAGYIGKGLIDVFFHGHGEENIRGILGKISDFVRNGIQMLKEGDRLDEVKEIFFLPAKSYLEKLGQRIRRFRLISQYLPWKKEMENLDQMMSTIGQFIADPAALKDSYHTVIIPIDTAVNDISRLMTIHKITGK